MLGKLTRPLLVAFAVFLATGQSLASAPTAADRATARNLMIDGRSRRHAGDLRGALEKFRAADALMGVPTTGLELARTQAELGLLVEALDTCARVSRYPATEDEPGPFREARNEARKLQAELRLRTPSLRFVFPANEDTRGVELRVDGVMIPREALQVPRLLNPGMHEVETISGSHRRVVTVTVEAGTAGEVALTLPQRDDTKPPAASGRGREPSPWVLGGFTTAAIGGTVGIVAGVIAWSERKGLDGACPNHTCPPNEADRIDRAHRYADVSTYAFVVGGIGAAVGIGALLTPGPAKSDAGVALVVPCKGGTLCLNGTF